MQWFKTVKATPEKVSEAMKYYYAELEEAKKETNLKNFTMLQQGVATISSYFEQRLDQRCDIDAIYNLFENQVKRKRAEITQRILDKYPNPNICQIELDHPSSRWDVVMIVKKSVQRSILVRKFVSFVQHYLENHQL